MNKMKSKMRKFMIENAHFLRENEIITFVSYVTICIC